MDTKKEEFLVRLRDTFRAEALEHLEAITTGLLAVERASDADRAPIVERIFREAHSLKGAARSVSLAGVEALCTELESIFEAMKREELSLSSAMLDAIHSALAVLAVLCESPRPLLSPEGRESEEHALAALRRIARGAVESRAETPTAAGASQPPGFGTHAAPASAAAPAPAEPRAPQIVTATLAPDTVRVSTLKLGAILLAAEELVGARIAASGRAAEVRALSRELAEWDQQRVRQAARQRRGHEDTTARLRAPRVRDAPHPDARELAPEAGGRHAARRTRPRVDH